MTLRVEKEPEDFRDAPIEHCCICDTPTRYWHKSDVALCPPCAKVTRRADLPSKKEWCEEFDHKHPSMMEGLL